jgi:PAS domain S-box-containing protein
MAPSSSEDGEQVATLRLEGDGASAREARRFVAETLARWGWLEREGDVTLVASELVTNALLHAPGTPPVLVLRGRNGALRVEVLDGSSAVPHTRPPETGSGMTGRGLHLVDGVADAWGATVLDVGKATWAEFGSTGAQRTSSAVAGEPVAADEALPEDWRTVTLVGLPVRLVLASTLQLDDLARELQLLAIERNRLLPPHYRSIAEEMLARYAGNHERGRREARLAEAAGADRMDLTIGLPEDGGPELVHLTELLDQLAELSRRGTLLSPPPSAEVSAFRHWCANEIGRQLAGRPPTPCPFHVDNPVSDDAAALEELRLREARYRSLIEAGELDVWRADADGNLITDMPKWRDHTGQRGDEVLGDGWLDSVHPEHRDRVRDTWRRAVDRRSVYRCEYPILGENGSERHVFARAVPLVERGVVREWVGTTVDVTERRRAEEQIAHQATVVDTLHEIGMALATTLDLGELVRTFVENATRLASADVGVFVLERETPIVAVSPPGAEPPAEGRTIEVVSKRSGRLHGRLILSCIDGGELDDRAVQLVEGVAAQAAVAIDNALLLEAEREARAAAERTQHRQDTLASAVERLAVASLDVDATARTMAELVVPVPCPWSCVELARRADGGPPIIIATAGPAPDDPRSAPDMAPFPLASGDRELGTLYVGGADLDEEQASLVRAIARRASLALGNAVLYSQQRNAALALQQALLPHDDLVVPGIDSAIRYLPAASADVGGDWYDLHLTDPTSLNVAVGDVQGKGVQAAAYMGQVRAAVRAYTLAGLSPAAVMQFLDRMWEQQAEVLTTCVYAHISVPTGLTRIAVAGHLPPLIVTASGDTRYAEVRPGPPLGAGVGLYFESMVTIGPGDGIVLFTDGLVEHRHRDLATGMARLAEVVAEAARSGSGVRSSAENGSPPRSSENGSGGRSPAGNGPGPRGSAQSTPGWQAAAIADAALSGMLEADHDDDVAVVVLRRVPHSPVAGAS